MPVLREHPNELVREQYIQTAAGTLRDLRIAEIVKLDMKVEDGKVRHGILNFRFNESLIHMLSNVEAMGTPVRASGEESFDMVAPPMKVKDFNFTEVTKF